MNAVEQKFLCIQRVNNSATERSNVGRCAPNTSEMATALTDFPDKLYNNL